MFRLSQTKSQTAVRVVRTEGDFPHVRRPSVWLACCTTTTCCLTLLLGAGGGLVGLLTGLISGSMSSRRIADNEVADIVLGIGRVILMALGYGVAGVLIGAGIGFVLDNMLGMF